MADAITALWHGNNYQSRFFWVNAMNLLRPLTCVSRVTFEANGPKSFDDVVVHYDPPVPRGSAQRVSAEFFQVKWHTNAGGRFGYEDLIDPKFIGAKSVSVLERLRDAKTSAPAGARFSLVTTYRTTDGDPLSKLLSSNDQILLIEKLFDGTTDRSQMGKVRKCWRDHLELATDEELQSVVEGLAIYQGHSSAQQLRDEINLLAEVAGLRPYSDAASDFRYDELARALKVRQVNELTAESLIAIAKEEDLWVGRTQVDNERPVIAIRSFQGLSTLTVPAAPGNTLWLTDSFRQRYLNDDLTWQRDIAPRVTEFLTTRTHNQNHIKLVLDAHASIAYLAGTVLHLKSGKRVDLVQKGRVGTIIWLANDGSSGDHLEHAEDQLSEAEELAVAVSITQPVDIDVRRYIQERLPSVGELISFVPPGGPGQQTVAGGAHAAAMAEQIAYHIKTKSADRPGALVHLFAACPNSVLFYLGQNQPAVGPIVVYEFDFDQRGNKSYQPSFRIE